jgi:hypothetical protein
VSDERPASPPPPELPPAPVPDIAPVDERPAAPPPRTAPESWSARPVLRISRHHLSTAVVIAAGLLVLGIILVVAVLPRVLSTPIGGPQPEPGAPSSDARSIQATLFYVSDDGRELVQASRQIAYGATTREQARHIVEAAIAPPPEGQRSAIPAGTTLRSVFLAADNTLFVDLGGEVVGGHPGGSLNESLTVFALVNALTVNLPDVTGVQILVNGRQVDTLAGHIDLRYPLGKALEWVRKGS